MFGPLTLIPRDPLIALVLVAVFLLGLILHGAAQSALAARLGDRTAVQAGFGGLGFQPHFSVVGVLLYLLLGLGLTRPVPLHLSGRRAAAVLLSGPLVLWLWALLVMAVRQPLQPLFPGADVIFQGLQGAAKATLLHAAFYLLPLPPLDGGRAAALLGGREWRGLLGQFASAAPWALYLVWLALWLSGAVNAVLTPLWTLMQTILGWLPY